MQAGGVHRSLLLQPGAGRLCGRLWLRDPEWLARPGGREVSSRCWPLVRAAKQMQMGLFQSPNLLATRHRSKEKAESVFVHIRPETHSSIFPSPPPPLKPK